MIISTSTNRHATCRQPLAESARRALPVRGADWFSTRRDHFVRQAIDDFFHLASWFTDLYAGWRGCVVVGEATGIGTSDQLQTELAAMVGTEQDNGPLWQLKDLCHRIWPQERRREEAQGALVDWLIGSLFHEAMKLKENLYLLAAYTPAAATLGGWVGAEGEGDRPLSTIARMVDLHAMAERLAGDVAGQMERIGGLFGQASCLLRMMMPELAANPLVLRLLMEMEEVVADLWGEPLEALMSDTFAGRPATGFCRAGSSYLRGQWYRQALAAYRRALDCDRGCDEAIVSVTRIEAILRELPEERLAVQSELG